MNDLDKTFRGCVLRFPVNQRNDIDRSPIHTICLFTSTSRFNSLARAKLKVEFTLESTVLSRFPLCIVATPANLRRYFFHIRVWANK